MTATGHALIGVLIASRFTNPIIGIPLSFVSHFAFDIMPHWDSGTNMKHKSHNRIVGEAIADVLVSIVASYVLFTSLGGSNIVYMYTCVLFAQLPDWLFTPYVFLKIKNPVTRFLKTVQQGIHGPGLQLPWGVITQLGAVVGTYYLFFHLFP